MLEQIESKKRRSSESPDTMAAKPQTSLLPLKTSENRDITTVECADRGETIQHLSRRESIHTTSRHSDEKEETLNEVILTSISFSKREPKQFNRRKPVLHMDEDPSKPWYFTHI
jgi:hypothetical protein